MAKDDFLGGKAPKWAADGARSLRSIISNPDKLMQWESSIQNVTNTLFNVRQGTKYEKALALASLSLTAYRLYTNRIGVNGLPTGFDANYTFPGIDLRFMGDHLMKQDSNFYELKLNGTACHYKIWEKGFAFLCRNDAFDDGPYFSSEEGKTVFYEYMKRLWKSDIMRLTAVDDRDDFGVESVSARNKFIGEHPVSWYLEKLRLKKGVSRTIRIAGPSGSGKTTLACNLAELVYGKEGRTLIIPAHVFATGYLHIATDYVSCLRPNVLIMDDFFSVTKVDFKILMWLDSLKEKGVELIVITHMTEESDIDLHKLGLRPGRIDEHITLGYPDLSLRYQIIQGFFAEVGITPDSSIAWEMAKKTDKLTGAYLRELVYRVSCYPDRAQEEIDTFCGFWARPHDKDEDADE